MLRLFVVAGCVGLLAGCGAPGGPDVNTQVFKTATQAAKEREAQLIEQWTKTAGSIFKSERADLAAVATTQPFGATVEANGQKLAIDFTSLMKPLMAPDANEREILRQCIQTQLKPFDQDRLIAIGFDKAKGMLSPYMLTLNERPALAATCGDTELAMTAPVLGGCAWTPVVTFPKTSSPIALSSRVLTAWKVEPSAIQKAALDNIRPQLQADAIVTTAFGSVGEVANLKPEANAALVLLPEFLPAARTALKTDGPLVTLIATRTDVRFVPLGNEELLAIVQRFWQSQLDRTQEPLLRTLVQLGEKGLTPYVPKPASQPTTTQSATKPATTRIYIVH